MVVGAVMALGLGTLAMGCAARAGSPVSGTSGATSGSGAGGSGAAGPAHAGVWRVMMLGDSVTGSTCYPQLLSRDLIAGKHTNFQLIGGVTNNCGSRATRVKTHGHGGYGVTYLPATSTRPRCAKQPQGCGSFTELQAWASEKPDIVLMHFATNDCWDEEPTATILTAYLAVLDEFRKQNPNVIFFISKIIPLIPAAANVIALNAAVTPSWAATNSTATSPVHIIDHWTGFDATIDTKDGVHPNAVGAQKMSTASYNALVAAGYF
jgi:lysophospholipase L1-like esterase